MCLYLRDTIEHIATSNIYVWKALVSSTCCSNCYYSPVFNYKYCVGELHKSELRRGMHIITEGLHSIGYNVSIFRNYIRRYTCYGAMNRFEIREHMDTIGLFVIPQGSHYYTDGYFYVSDTLKFLRTLTVNEFFNYMINR